jgi:hypothetical protein
MSDRHYPLKWPEGWDRTPGIGRRSSPYRCTLDRAVKDLLEDLRRWKARDITISSNIRTGLGVSMTEGMVKDPGVAVYWTHRDGAPRVMACDCWHRLRDNVRSIGLAVEYLRGLERCGASAILDRALKGFAALPEAPSCWKLLGVPQGSPRALISERFRELAATAHPDHGGDSTAFGQLTQAYHEALGQSRQ